MTIALNHDHRVQFRFENNNINDFDSRMQELDAVQAWLDRLVEWHPDMYSIRILYSGTVIDVWFLKEEHATWSALRWT